MIPIAGIIITLILCYELISMLTERNNLHDVDTWMPRPKGSKNKPKLTNDYASQIVEKQESIVSLTAEITSITANIDTLKADLKEKKAALKSTQKELTKLEAKKAAADQKAAEAAKKAEAEDVLKKLLASGVSADEILEKLK